MRKKRRPPQRQEPIIGARLREFARRNRAIIRAYLVFFGAILLFATGLFIMSVKGLFSPTLTALYARATGLVLNLFGAGVRVSGSLISGPRYTMEVIPGCTDLYITPIFLAAVIAYPSRLRAKLLGIGLGLPAIYLLNLVRLTSLFYIGLYLPRFADRAHLLVWQSLMIILTLLLWLLWVERFAHAPQKRRS